MRTAIGFLFVMMSFVMTAALAGEKEDIAAVEKEIRLQDEASVIYGLIEERVRVAVMKSSLGKRYRDVLAAWRAAEKRYKAESSIKRKSRYLESWKIVEENRKAMQARLERIARIMLNRFIDDEIKKISKPKREPIRKQLLILRNKGISI